MDVVAENPDLSSPPRSSPGPSGNWTNNLAIKDLTGTGVTQDFAKAASWYRGNPAERNGDANAQFNLGVLAVIQRARRFAG